MPAIKKKKNHKRQEEDDLKIKFRYQYLVDLIEKEDRI